MNQITRYVLPILATLCLLSLYLTGQTALLENDPLATKLRASANDARYAQTKDDGDRLVRPKHYDGYIPAVVETYVMDHAKELHYDTPADEGRWWWNRPKNPSGCTIWKNPTATPYYEKLHQLIQELRDYSQRVANFPPLQEDLRAMMQHAPQEQVCQSLELHPDGLSGIFQSQQLSYTRAGYSEPLLTPMRHPEFCFHRDEYIMNMNYMVHDFSHMCRQLKNHTRTVFIDMGASLHFHENAESPAMYILELYRQFGFVFDHIYAFEITKKDPTQVFQKVPTHLMPSYHWINVAVSPEPGNKFNPLDSILSRYNQDDLVVVKLDVDTTSVEIPLADQIAANPYLSEMIDHFYFEHHVHMEELARDWKKSMKGTIEESLQRFRQLREVGVAAHFWP